MLILGNNLLFFSLLLAYKV